MKLIISFCIFIFSFTSVQSQDLSIFGKLQNSTSILCDSLDSFVIAYGKLHTKLGANRKTIDVFNTSTLKKISEPNKKEAFKVFMDSSNLDYFKNRETCERPNSILHIYDTSHNILFYDSNSTSSYSQTPNGNIIFTNRGESPFFDFFNIQAKRKIRIKDLLLVSDFWQAIAPNDSLIIICDESCLQTVNLITGIVDTVLYIGYYEIPKWYSSIDRKNNILHWNDSLFLFNSEGNIKWRINEFRHMQNLCISNNNNYVLASLYYRDSILLKIYDNQLGNKLSEIALPVNGVPQYTNLQFIDSLLIIYSNSYKRNEINSTIKTDVICYDFENNSISKHETINGVLSIDNVYNIIRSFYFHPSNPSEIIIKDWKR